MADFLIHAIPLPLPRPIMEEVVHGAKDAGIKFDIPIPETSDIDLSFPLVGMNWITYPWTLLKEQSSVLKGKIMLNQYNEYLPGADRFEDLYILGIVIVGLFVLVTSVYVIGYTLENFYKLLRRKFW